MNMNDSKSKTNWVDVIEGKLALYESDLTLSLIVESPGEVIVWDQGHQGHRNLVMFSLVDGSSHYDASQDGHDLFAHLHSTLDAMEADVSKLWETLGETGQLAVEVDGVHLESVRFNSDTLIELRGKLQGDPVAVKYNVDDLSNIYVFDPFTNEYINVPAVA